MTRCGACGGRLGHNAAYCPTCATPRGQLSSSAAEFELDVADLSDPGTEVRFERPRAARGRVITAAVLLVGAAVVASVALGSGGGGTAGGATTTTTIAPRMSADATTTTTTADATTTEAAVATTAPDEGTTTTSSPIVQLGGNPLLGEPTGLSLLLGGSQLAIVDLDRARLTIVPSSGFVVGAEITPVGLAYQGGNAGALYLLAPGVSAPRRIGESGTYLGEGPAGQAWFQLYDPSVNGPVYLHIDGPGAEPVTAQLPDRVAYAFPDGAGGWVAAAGGGIYRVGPEGRSARVATGDVLGVRNGRALARSCDDELRCRYMVVDVVSGAIRSGPTMASDTRNREALLSTDGSWILELASGQPRTETNGRLVVRSLEGASIELGPSRSECLSQYCPVSPAWAPTGGWLFWVIDATTIGAWRPGLDQPRLVQVPVDVIDGRVLTIQSIAVGTAEQLAAFAGAAFSAAPD